MENEETPKPKEAPKPQVVCTQQADGTWIVSGNVANPKRMLMQLGAQLVIETFK